MKGFEQIPLENESSEVAPRKPASGKLKKLGKWLAGAAIVTGGAAGLERKAFAEDSASPEPLKTEKEGKMSKEQIEKALTTPILSGIDYDNLLTVDPSTITQTSLTKEFTQWIIEKNPAMAAKIVDALETLRKNQSPENQKNLQALLAVCSVFDGAPDKQIETKFVTKTVGQSLIDQAITERGGREAIEKGSIEAFFKALRWNNYLGEWAKLDPKKDEVREISYTPGFLEYIMKNVPLDELKKLKEDVQKNREAGVNIMLDSAMSTRESSYMTATRANSRTSRVLSEDEKNKLKKLMLGLGK